MFDLGGQFFDFQRLEKCFTKTRMIKETEFTKYYIATEDIGKGCVCVIDYLIRVELTYTINQPNLTFIALQTESKNVYNKSCVTTKL